MTYIPYMLYEDEIFEDILTAPKPLALVTYLLGESCLLSSMGCHFRGPGGAPLPLHSDNGNGIPAPFSATSQVANVNYALTPLQPPGRRIGDGAGQPQAGQTAEAGRKWASAKAAIPTP